MGEKPIIFISCGQQTEPEKQLGTAIAQLVRDLTPFEPYFAEYQTSLEGLSKHVLGALNRCIGFVVVLHARGIVLPINRTRASVWVEQEVAIAAFLQQVLGRTLHLAAFSEKGVAREGIREALLLNPREFNNNQEILDHLRAVLPTWKTPTCGTATSDLAIEYKKRNITQKRHDYELILLLTNRGTESISQYHVDLEFPLALLDQPNNNVHFIPNRSSHSIGFFRTTQNMHGQVFPGDILQIMSVQYYVDRRIFMYQQELLREMVRAKLYIGGAEPQVFEKSMVELQVF